MVQEIKTQTSTSPVTEAPLPRMTYEEFLQWADEDTRAEWVNGEVILMSPASKRHQRLVRFLISILGAFIEAHNLGDLLPAPFQMKSGLDLPGREPDLIFVATEHLDRIKENYLNGPADVAIEIISPDSRSRDRGDKYYEYEQAGVREYWLIDPLRTQAEFYRLGADGIYTSISVGDDGVFHSDVIEGLGLKVDWLWQDPLPTLMSVLKEWGLVN
jgi:Uma2 family endonuclease